MLGALSLLLNGGGVGQLKTITDELNKTFDGHEDAARDVLNQIRIFMHAARHGKKEIVTAIEQVNSLSIVAQQAHRRPRPGAAGAPAGDRVGRPAAGRPHQDAVGARAPERGRHPGDPGVQGRDDHEPQRARPDADRVGQGRDDFPNSLQIFLTYPFIDAIVGKNPQQARDLHMGDYTNLSIDLDLDLKDILGGGVGIGDKLLPCDDIPNPQIGQLCKQGDKIIQVTQEIIDHLPVPNPGGGGGIPGLPLPGGGGGKKGGGGGGGILGGGGPLGPACPGRRPGERIDRTGDSDAGGRAAGVDTDLAAMLLWGMMPR